MSLRKQQNKTYFSDPTKETQFRDTFKLPDGEERLASVFAVFNIKGHPDGFSGNAYISTSYILFESIDGRSCKCTIPLASVRRVERLPAKEEDVITGGFVLLLTCFNGLKLVLHLQSLYKTNDQFCNTLANGLRSQVSAMKPLKAFAKTLFSEYLMTDGAGGGLSKLASNVGILVDVGEGSTTLASLEQSMDWTTRGGLDGHFHGGLGLVFKFPGDPKKLKEKSKMKLWKEYLAVHGRNLTLVRYPTLNRLVQVGLPNRLRGEIWELSCGSLYLRLQNPGGYEKILEDHKDEKSSSADDIEKDLHRSLPEYPAYQHSMGIDTMRRILTAYSWSNPELGYCQAMNLIVASFLIYMSEEQCFWCLSVLCDRLLPGYYSPSMYGTVLDQKVFESLVSRHLPTLYEHFQTVDVQLSVSSLPWFLSLYISAMPMVFAFRIIDCFFLMGPRVLFQVGLAILRINHDKLLETTDDGVFISTMKEYFSTLDEPAYPDAKLPKMRSVTRFQELLVVAFRDFSVVTESVIAAERRRFRADVVVSVESFAKRTALRNLFRTGRLSKDQLSLVYDHFQLAFLNAREEQRSNRKVSSDNPLASSTTSGETQNEMVLSRSSFGRFVSDIATWARDERLIRNAFYEHIERIPKDHGLIDRLFHAWDRGNKGHLTLQDAVDGLNSVLFNDLMSNLSWIFELHDSDHDGYLTKDEVLQLSESLLFIFRNEPGDRYLASVSSLIQNIFEFVEATNNEGDQTHDVDKTTETHRARSHSIVTEQPNVAYLGLNAFRMCVLADELLEQFFDSDLTESWRLEVLIKEPVPSPPQKRFGATATWLGGVITSVLDDHKDTINKLADEVGRRLDIQTVEQRPSIGKLDPAAAAQEPQQRSSLFAAGREDPPPRPSLSRTSTLGVNNSLLPPSASTSTAEGLTDASGGAATGDTSLTPISITTPTLNQVNPWATEGEMDVQAAAERAMARPQFVIDDAEEDDDEGDEDNSQLLDQVQTFAAEDEKEAESSSQVKAVVVADEAKTEETEENVLF